MLQASMIDSREPNVAQTEAIYMKAVKKNGRALEYVHNQTEAICMEAVKQNGYALQFVIHQTEAICMKAIKENGCALRYVKNQTDTICMEAVKQTGFALKYVHNQTESICMEAVREYGLALEFVHNQTESICLEAVKQNGHALRYVKNQTDAICLTALLSIYVKNTRTKFSSDLYDIIIYPSPQLITILVKLYPSHTDTIMSTYATDIMETYRKCSNAIVVYIAKHANELIYKPNNIGALVCHIKWYATVDNAKTLFLMV